MFPRVQNANNRRNGQRRLAALVAREMTVAIQQMQAGTPPPAPNAANAEGARFNIKNFTSCNPPKYSGNDGATALLQWFEGIESVFSIAECPNHLRVKYVASMFTKRALTWWNKEKLTRGMEVAHALPWEELKTLMSAEFCPRNEVKKLEEEFWNLKQIGGNNSEYTTRFHELSLLVPRMVTPESVAIERYMDGLPPKIRDIVLGSNPTNVEVAVRLAASLTDNLVRDGELTRTKKGKKNDKKVEGETSKAEKPAQKKKKVETIQNYATTIPNPNAPLYIQNNPIQPMPQQPQFRIPPNPNHQGKPYTGIYPLCTTCGYHHTMGYACRWCTKCTRYGHWAASCRSGVAPNIAPIPVNAQAPAPQVPRCFACGDLNHVLRNCPNNRQAPAPAPQQQPPARGRAYVLNANPAQENNVEVNGP